MNPEFAPELVKLYARLFDELDAGIAAQNATSFWSLGVATPRLKPKERDLQGGSWYGEGDIPGHTIKGAVSISLTPGEFRVGLLMPATAVFHGTTDLSGYFSEAYGSRPDIVRLLPGGMQLFDRILRDDPFTASWLMRAVTDDLAREVLVMRMACIVTTIWKSAVQVLAGGGQFDLQNDIMVCSAEPINTNTLASELPVVIYDFAQQSDQSYITILRSSLDSDDLASELERRGIEFKQVLPIRKLEAA